MRNYEAVLFDVDGTLLNTPNIIVDSYETALKFHGHKVERKNIEALGGKSLIETYQILTGETNVTRFTKFHKRFQEDSIHLVHTYWGVEETLEELKKEGVKIAAVTSRTENALILLEKTEILPYFECVITGDEVENHKPHPEPVNKALKILRVSPFDAMTIGDTDADMYSGKNAGTKTTGVTYGSMGIKIRETNPDFVVDYIKDIIPIIVRKSA